jgi:hypothetical protein
MRLLFLFLVLVNGLVYLWYTLHQQPASASSHTLTGNHPKLVLLSELPDKSRVVPMPVTAVSVEEPEPEQSVRSVVKRSCYTLGPFMNDDDLSEAAKALIQSGRPIEKRASDKKEQIGYWVFIPPFPNREAALSKGEELKLLGEKHLYVVKKPEKYRNAISLGVFKGKTNAERRYRQMKNLGFDVKLEGRYRQNPVYWIDYSEQKDSQALPLEKFVGTQRLDRPCETVASSLPLP